MFSLFRYYLPLKKGGALHLNKVLVTQGCIVPSLIEIGPTVLEKKIFKFRQCIFAFCYYLPLEKGWGPSFEQTTCVPFTQGCFVSSLVEIGPVDVGIIYLALM